MPELTCGQCPIASWISCPLSHKIASEGKPCEFDLSMLIRLVEARLARGEKP